MKKRNRMQRLLTVVLSLTLIITMMPAMNYQWTEEADAATYYYIYNADQIKGSWYTKSSKLASLLDDIFSGEKKIVFKDSKCSKAVNTRLTREGILPNNGNLKYVPDGRAGTSCYIYANGVYHALFGGTTGEKNDFKGSESEIKVENGGNASYEKFVNWGIRSEPGAMIRASGHSMILLYYDKDTIVTLDANGDRNGGISARVRSWNNAKFNVEYIIQVSNNRYRQLYPNDATTTGETLDTSYAGTYVCVKAGGASAKKSPYENSPIHKTYSKNQTLEIQGRVINSVGNYWYKTSEGAFIYSGNVKRASVASSLSINMNNVQVTYGKSKNFDGTISSNYNITYVSAYMDGTLFTSFAPNCKSINIRKSAINNYKCATLSSGNHTLKIVAKDTSGKTVEKNVTVTVSGQAYAPINAPTITYEDIYEGKRVTIKSNTAGSTLVYWNYKCTNGNASTSSDRVTFDVFETGAVTAYSTLNGRNSGQAYAAVTVNKLAAPSINVQQKGNSAYVTISNTDAQAEIYYSVNGKAYNRYYGTFISKEDATVQAYAKRKGYKSSDTASAQVSLTAPDIAKVSIVNDSAIIAKGSAAAVRWNRDEKATSYTVRLYQTADGKREELQKKENITENSYGFTLEDAGQYQITVEAINAFGSSGESGDAVVEARNPVTATFRNDDGTVLNEVTVDYNSAPSEIPKPSKRGYVFIGWKAEKDNAATSLDAYKRTKLTEDITYTAQYQKEVYRVKFLDTDGKVISVKEIEFDEPAEPPAYEKVPEGYKFVGWNITSTSENDSKCDYNHVDCNMEIQAVIAWENSELPVITKIKEATANGDAGYHISFSVTNWDQADTSAYIVIALKTKDSKSGIQKTVFVDRRKEILQKNESGENKEQQFDFNLAYKGNASTAEVMVLECKDDETTGSAYSKTDESPIIANQYWGEWKEWTTEKPQEQNGRAIETKTQYRYRTKQMTTVTDSVLSGNGWTWYNTTYYWGAWSNYSGWTTNYVAANEYTDVQSKTQYKYYRCYCNNNWWHDWYGVTKCFSCSGKYSTYEYAWFDTPYSAVTTNATGDGKVKRACLDGNVFWYYYPQYYNTRHGERTVYRYRTRGKHTVNYYYRWNNWSEWSDQIATASANQEVETRTLYRYRDEVKEFADATMDTAGTVGSFSGTITSDEDLTGKVATIMAYQSKNMDANKYQMQYIGQTVIGEGNSYDFSFIPKEEPTTDSGNYVVALGVQGTTGLINVGILEAPKREFTVTLHYTNDKGEDCTLSEQMVKEGEDVNLDDIVIPEREGYYFAGWGSRTTNIIDNCSIEAIYLPIRNTVVYVDWVNESIGFQTALTGEKLEPPYNVSESVKATQGYTFKGWDILLQNPDAVVTGNMVVTAEYDIATYKVEFVNEKGEVIDTQNIKYGESAKLPENLNPEGMVFLGWSTEEQWWNVNADMRVEPILIYEKSATVPISNVEGYYEGRDLDLELKGQDDEDIYYTTDGTDPSDPNNDSRKEYTDTIHLEESTLIRASSEADGKNSSDVIEIIFDYSEEDYYNPYVAWESIGEYNVVAEPNKEITLNLKLDKNLGLVGYHFLIECDQKIFSVDYDENSNIVCKPGSASDGGNLFVSEYENSGWQILWFAAEENYKKGSLFELKLKVAEDAENGVYPIRVSYAKANTLTSDTLETELSTKDVSLEIGTDANLLGDANGDGSVTAMDVVRIARYVVGLAEIPTEREYLADVNRDGKITIADAILLARSIVGLEQVS